MFDINKIKFDEKGLVPCIVQDFVTGRVLTLAYMNRQSLEIGKNKGKLIYSYKNEDAESGDNYFVDIYHFKGCFDKSKIKVNPDEVTDYRFVDVDDMEELEKEEGFLHYERVKKALASR